MLSRSIECRAAEKGRQAFGTRMVYRETFFANPVASSSAPYPQEMNPWSSGEISRFTHQRWKRVRNKHQFKIRGTSLDRQPTILSSLMRETLSRIMEQTNNDCPSTSTRTVATLCTPPKRRCGLRVDPTPSQEEQGNKRTNDN